MWGPGSTGQCPAEQGQGIVTWLHAGCSPASTPCPHENPQRQVILTRLPIDSVAVLCQGFRRCASWPSRDEHQASHRTQGPREGRVLSARLPRDATPLGGAGRMGSS